MSNDKNPCETCGGTGDATCKESLQVGSVEALTNKQLVNFGDDPHEASMLQVSQAMTEVLRLRECKTELCDGIEKMNNVGVGFRRENERLREELAMYRDGNSAKIIDRLTQQLAAADALRDSVEENLYYLTGPAKRLGRPDWYMKRLEAVVRDADAYDAARREGKG